MKEAGTKAAGTMSNVMADVSQAESAMKGALKMEKKMHKLREQIWDKAKTAAEGEIDKVLKEVRAEADKKAKVWAKKKAAAFKKKMKALAAKESAKASKVYMDLMTGAGAAAAKYAKLGDDLIGQSASLQMNAGLAQAQANQFITVGDMGEAQK